MIEWIISSCVLIVVIMLLRRLLKGHISLRLQYALWVVVCVRLLVPVQLGASSMSVMNAVEHSRAYEVTTQALEETTVYSDTIRNTTLTIDEARQIGSGTLHRVEGYSVESGHGDLHTYTFVDSLSNVLPRVLRLVWYVGITAAALCLLISNVGFARQLKKARKALEVEYPLTVYVSAAVETPCLFGLLRPAVYVTPEVAGNAAALNHVLAHELTHYRHLDHVWSLLRSACLVVHWYNPLVWWAVRFSRQDAELACDEGTIRRIGEAERADYGRTLIGLTCTSRSLSNVLLNATTMTGNKKSIKERIVLIAKRPKTAAYTLAAVILIAAVAVGCTFTGAKAKNAELKCVEQDGDRAAYELTLSEGIHGVAVSVEQWVDGVCVQSNAKRYSADITAIGIEGDVVRAQDGGWSGSTIDVSVSAKQDDTLLGSFDFPQGRAFSAMSFDAFSEADRITAIAAGEEYILAVMLFAPPPNGAIFSAWNCEQFMEDPSMMEKPECMVIVRVQFLSEEPEQAAPPAFPMQQTAPETPAALK